ncbi:MAG: tetratricopeptide repeat protein, partial [Planctomycetaceae bacterium]|nr:tetratricopeptide repeat protein [Planctomycetaceae bacterium]
HAAVVWRKLVDAKPKDAVVAAQVAGLMATADKSLLGDAAELLRRAIELEPEALSHREQLGEVLDSDGKKDESLKAWRSMAEELRRNANNLAQLADVLSRFGYRDETLTTIDAACELDHKSLELRFQQAELRRKWKQFESAMSALAEAAALADTSETFDRVVQIEVKVLSESELLTGRIEELNAALGAGLPTPPKRPTAGLPGPDLVPNNTKKRETFGPDQRRGQETRAERAFDPGSPAAQQFRLAKYLEAADKLREATVAARKAVELAPRNGVFIQAAARMLTLDSQWLSAVELYERLLKVDRRFRIDSLRAIAELEQKLGRKEKALKAGRELLAAAPGNPESAEFVVEVCLRFGQNAEALQILRRASRQNVADKRLALRLVERLMEDGPSQLSGTALAAGKQGGQRRDIPAASAVPLSATDEAREILWRVFEQTAKSDDRIEVVRKLAELSVFPGEFAKLVQRLERYRAEPKLRRDASLALVQVHEQAGDTQQARRELERWLPQAPRDPALLARMVSLCESAGDLEAAIAHQQRMAEVTRKREADEHLVVLLRRAGRDADADALATRWLESERDPVKVLREIDRLLTSFSTPGSARSEKQPLQLALKLTQSWRDRDPQNWEFLVREALVLVELFEPEKAALVRDDLLKLELPDDTPSVLVPTKTSTSAAVERIDRIRRRFANSELPIVDYGQARRIALDGRLMFGTYWLSHPRPGNAADLPTPPAAEGMPKLRQAWDNVYALPRKAPAERYLPAYLALQEVASEDIAAEWLALRALSSVRQESLAHFMESELKLTGEPLDNATLDRLLVSLRRLLKHDETLEWSAYFPLPELVARELQRAGRTEHLQRLLADLEAAKPSLSSLGWMIQQAARRNDADAVTRLLRRYADEAAANPTAVANLTGQRYANPGFVAWWVQNVMARLTADGSANSAPSKEQVLKFLDDTWGPLSDARMPPHSNAIISELIQILGSRMLSQTTTPQPLTSIQVQSMAASRQGWLVWKNPSNSVPRTVEFPEVTKAPEFTALRVLMQAHAIASEGKWSDDLREHLRLKAAKAEPQSRERFTAQLGLASLFVWDGKNDDALPVMRELFALAAQQPSLQHDIAWFHQRYGAQEVALDLLDRIETRDGQLVKEMEQRAVQLAGKLGRRDRVQLAAERLFGMKLEPQEELQLAATLSGLGLHEQAEAIRQRLPQRAGNNLAVLQQAMQERIDAKKVEEACQIAEQIVRRTSPANTLIGSVQQATFGGGQQARVITTTSTARTKALALLGQQGRLGPLIEQAEQQFDRSPQSLKLFGQLAELYGAAGTPEKQTGLLVRLADSDAPDPQFRLTLARALVSAGKAELAVPHFLFAIERLPNATAQVLFEAEQILSELGHVDELAAIVLKSKLAVNDQQRLELFRRIVQRLHGPPIRAKLIIQLFEKALREAPEFHPMLAAQLLALSGSVWQQEELWPVARDLAVPPSYVKNVGPLYGVGVVNKSAGSPVNLLTLNVIELARQTGKLGELEAHTVAAMQSHPIWKVGGNVTLGLTKLRQRGQTEKVKPLLDVLAQSADGLADRVDGRLEHAPSFHLLTCGLGHELAIAGDFAAATDFYELTTPELALEECRVFGKEPAMQQLAVRIVNRMLANLDDPSELTRQAGSPLFVEAAKITAEIQQPYVAARLAQAMITRWQLPSANNSDGGTWLEQLEHRFANARAAIKPEMLPDIVTGDAKVVRTPTSGQTPNRPDVGVRSTPRIDLLPHVTGDSLTNLRLDSPFVPLLKEAAQDKDMWAKWTESLRRMGTPARPSDDANEKDKTGRSAHPTDLSLAILASLTELTTPEPKVERTALPQLVEIAKSHLKIERPRTAPAGFHPQLGLWLIARECLIRDELKKLGHELAELATESAALHFDPRFQWAILRERGELALKSGDKELASKLWTRLAVDVLRPRSAEETVPMLLGQQFVWSANWPSTRLHRARDLCRLTLNAEMPDLSLAIFRDTINWTKSAPFQPKFENDESRPSDPPRYRGTVFIDENFMASNSLAEDILATWDTLEPEWRAKGVAADEIFATLLECVLPTSRPEDVFVFAVGHAARVPVKELPETHASRVRHNASLALRLVELAVAEKRIDSLTQRLAEREKTTTNLLALRLIQLLLARLTNDEQRLDVELTKLAQHDWSKPAFQNGRIATQIVWLLTPLTERREQVSKLFEQWIAPVSKASPRDEHPVADLRRWLAKQQLEQQQTDKAKETIGAHLRHMDQVWSATGAMDGQHLRRLELIAIATDYASAGLTREAIDLLAQVADARWPDRYPDENPGAVLAILEAKLKSRPAQERYELWRAWSLPNDGVKSMRMLTGSAASEISNSKFQISNLKSTAFLLVEAAREADRLAELDAFVEEQMKQRPSDRIHVLLALIHFANKAPAVAETLVRQQITLWESQAGKSNSATRTRVWDDWLLSEACSRHESLRELAEQLAKRAESGAR